MDEEHVDIDKLRELIENWRRTTNQTSQPVDKIYELAAQDLENHLPAPKKKSMAEIPWKHSEHFLAEAEARWANASSDVIMLGKDGTSILAFQDDFHYLGVRPIAPHLVFPTGRKFRFSLETESGLDPERFYADQEDDVWFHFRGQWYLVDEDMGHIRLPEAYGPYKPVEE